MVSNKDEEAVVTPSSPVDPDKKSDNFTTNRNEQSADAFQVFTLRNQGIGSVIILCCPNAGYYECMHYEVFTDQLCILIIRITGLDSTLRMDSRFFYGTIEVMEKVLELLLLM